MVCMIIFCCSYYMYLEIKYMVDKPCYSDLSMTRGELLDNITRFVIFFISFLIMTKIGIVRLKKKVHMTHHGMFSWICTDTHYIYIPYVVFLLYATKNGVVVIIIL